MSYLIKAALSYGNSSTGAFTNCSFACLTLSYQLFQIDILVLVAPRNLLVLYHNNANLRDLITAVGLVILLKSNQNRRSFGFCDLETWWMTSKKIIGNIVHAPRRYVCHFIAIREFKLDLSSGNVLVGAKSSIFRPVWPWNLMKNKTKQNKANLRDLIAATGLVILLKLDSNHRFFSHVTLKFQGNFTLTGATV